MTVELLPSKYAAEEPASVLSDKLRAIARHPSVLVGGLVILAILLMAVSAPWLGTVDPTEINPSMRNREPGYSIVKRDDEGRQTRQTFHFGTDSVGRDVYSRVVYGARVSMTIGVVVASLSVGIGLVIGLFAGYLKWLDAIVMRLMDGLMAIPTILLAISVVSLSRAGLSAVIVAVVIPEVPRVVRLVRAIVLSIREEPYVEAAMTLGTPTLPLLVRHVLPNTIPPLIVQGTFICASAILIEAVLSFLGIGIPPETPTWGKKGARCSGSIRTTSSIPASPWR